MDNQNQSIKQVAFIVAIVMMLSFAYAAYSYVRSYGQSVYPNRAFTVQAEGKAVVVPDVAQFSFGVLTQGGKDLATLQETNTKSVNKIIEYLKSKKVDAKDITTQGYSLTPRYQYIQCFKAPCPPTSIVGYEINQSVSVKIRDFTLIGELLSGVVKNGANNVSQMSFTLDNPDSAQNEARAQALEKAKAKAQSIAKAGGFRVGQLLSIDESFQPVSPYAYGMGGSERMMTLDAAKSIASTPTIEPGSQEVKVQVYVRYAIR